MPDAKDPKELFGSTPMLRLFFTAALPGTVSMFVSCPQAGGVIVAYRLRTVSIYATAWAAAVTAQLMGYARTRCA